MEIGLTWLGCSGDRGGRAGRALPDPDVASARQSRGFTLVELMVVVTIIGVLAGLMIGVSTRTYGANATSAGDQLTSALAFAKLRAVATRRFTRVEIQAQTATVWQSTQTGLVAPTAWQFVQRFTISRGVSVWNATTTVQASPGATVAMDPAVDFMLDFTPDGSSTGGTLFVTDSANARPSRVVVYRATGSSYVRAQW
jgi:prepilin-type N-terminal cleavage/methylation domain-containing protein